VRGRRAVRAEAADDGRSCGNCAHARVIPDVRPVEWRCRGGHAAGGLVYRGDTGALSQYLRAPRRCKDYRPMGAREGGRGRRRG
jgi:hypothetical protein